MALESLAGALQVVFCCSCICSWWRCWFEVVVAAVTAAARTVHKGNFESVVVISCARIFLTTPHVPMTSVPEAHRSPNIPPPGGFHDQTDN